MSELKRKAAGTKDPVAKAVYEVGGALSDKLEEVRKGVEDIRTGAAANHKDVIALRDLIEVLVNAARHVADRG